MLVPFKKLHYTDPNVLSTIFQNDSEVDNNYDDDNDKYEGDDLVDSYPLHQDTVFELLEPGTFVGLRNPSNAIEPFFIAEVISKGFAEKTWRMNLVILLWQVKCMPKLYIYKNLLIEKNSKVSEAKKVPTYSDSHL